MFAGYTNTKSIKVLRFLAIKEVWKITQSKFKQALSIKMTGFIQFCNRLSPLDKVAIDDLLKKLKTKTYPKNENVLDDGQTCKYLFFIVKGLMKINFNGDGKEFIMRFFRENEMLTVLDSFSSQTPSHYLIQTLEPTDVILIRHDDLEELCKKHHCIETFFRKFISMASVNMMNRINEMLEENATSRYQNFLRDNNALIQRVSLGDLANYLGITQVSLSRIRAK